MPDRVGVGRNDGTDEAPAQSGPDTSTGSSGGARKNRSGKLCYERQQRQNPRRAINGGHRADFQAARRERGPADEAFLERQQPPRTYDVFVGSPASRGVLP